MADDFMGDDLEMDLSFTEEGADEPKSLDDNPTVESSPFRFSLDHALSFRLGSRNDLVNNRSGANFEYAGPVGESLYAKLDATSSLYWSADHQARSSQKSYTADGLIREAWLQSSSGSLTVKAGLQSIVWGDVEGSQATDTLNPVDNREFLFVDFEDVRIGQPTLSLTAYQDNVTWETFVTPAPTYNKNPDANSIYSLYNPLAGLPQVDGKESHPEVGLRGKVRLGVAEVALLVAQLTPNQPSLQLDPAGFLLETAKPYRLTGLNFNYPVGDTLYKIDLGYKTNQGVNDQAFGLVYRDRMDTALGVETTVDQHSLFASVTVSKLYNWDESLAVKEQQGFASLGWSKSYLHEDLACSMGMTGGLSLKDRILNGSVEYTLNDRLKLSTALFFLSVQDQTSLFYPYRDEHRAVFKVRVQL